MARILIVDDDRSIRRTGRDVRPESIVVTARDDMQSTVKAIQLGAYEYSVKHVDIDRLHEVVVRRALAGRHRPSVGDRRGRSYEPQRFRMPAGMTFRILGRPRWRPPDSDPQSPAAPAPASRSVR